MGWGNHACSVNVTKAPQFLTNYLLTRTQITESGLNVNLQKYNFSPRPSLCSNSACVTFLLLKKYKNALSNPVLNFLVSVWKKKKKKKSKFYKFTAKFAYFISSLCGNPVISFCIYPRNRQIVYGNKDFSFEYLYLACKTCCPKFLLS